MNNPFLKIKLATQSSQGVLKKRYIKIIQIMCLLLIIEFAIGKINGGERVSYVKPQERFTSTDNQQMVTQIFKISTLKNGATQIIFELKNSDYDYQKKSIDVTSEGEKIKGNFINNRFYFIETNKIKSPLEVHVVLSALEADGKEKFMDYQFNLPAKVGTQTHFEKIQNSKYDEILVDDQISRTNQSISKNNNQIAETQKKIEAEQTEIRSLQEQLKNSKVKEDQEDISQQISKYQQGISDLSVTLSTLQTDLETNKSHLSQLKQEKEQINDK